MPVVYKPMLFMLIDMISSTSVFFSHTLDAMVSSLCCEISVQLLGNLCIDNQAGQRCVWDLCYPDTFW